MSSIFSVITVKTFGCVYELRVTKRRPEEEKVEKKKTGWLFSKLRKERRLLYVVHFCFLFVECVRELGRR